MGVVVDTLQVNAETYVLRVYTESPPLGVLPFNAFVILGSEPILVDTHGPLWRREYLDAVTALVDPKDVRWVFLTHDDRDHSGNLLPVLEMCPNATLITQWLMVGRMKDEFVLPLPRLRFCNPGETFTASGRTFGTCIPPIHDSPSSAALFDPKHRTLFSADSFGALARKKVDEAGDLPPDELAAAMTLFNGMAPWVHDVDLAKFARRFDPIRAFDPTTILSSHGPMIRGGVAGAIDVMMKVPESPPFVGMDQHGLEARMAALGLTAASPR